MARPYGFGGTPALKNAAQRQGASDAVGKAQAAQARGVAHSHEDQARRKARPKKGKQPTKRSKTPGASTGATTPALPGRDQALLAQGYTPGEIAAANAQAGLQYGPAIGLTKQAIQNTPGYFQDYRNTITGSQGAVNQLSDPAVAQAFVRAQGTGQTVLGPGAAPDAANNDALAAAARQALGNASAQALQGQNLADNSYFSKLGANSQLQQMGATTALNNQLGTQRTAQANAKVNALSTLHQQNLTNTLEAETLLSGNALKRYQAKLTAGTARAKIKATAKTDNTAFEAKYGVSQKVYRNMTPKERLAWKKTWDKSGQTGAEKINQAKLAYYRKHGYFPPTGKPGGSSAAGTKDPYGNTPKQQRAANSEWTKVRAIAGEIVQPGDNWRAIYKLLVVKYPTADSTILKAAAMRVTKTHIPHGVLSGLRKQGINTGQIHNPKKRGNAKNQPGTTGNTPGPNGQARPG